MFTSRGFRPPHAVFVLLSLVVLMAPGCSRESRPEVWIIGLDAADWDLIGPLMDQGRLPHLASLRDGGAHGILLSDEPMLSPVVWNSIATGKTADQHGVTWFMTDAPDGSKVPVGTADRKVRALWNIASEAGLTSGIVGWWATWPAEPVAGFMVSDDVGWHGFGITGSGAHDAGKTHPSELMADVMRLLPGEEGIAPEALAPLIDLPLEELAGTGPDSTAAKILTNLRQAMSTTMAYTDLVIERLDEERPDLLAVYYEGTDTVAHLCGRFMPPRLPWVPDLDFARYRDAVFAYWEWQDAQLGKLLEKRGPQTLVVVVSDHGFRLGPERRREDEFSIETADADHMPDGVVIIDGPGVVPGARITGADVYDVAPTVLYALGLPVAEDMHGRVLTDAFAPARLDEFPVALVPTYETSPLVRDAAPQRDLEAVAGREKMLRSLGYLSGGPTRDVPPAAEGMSLEQTVNLATVLMHQDKASDAAVLLERAREAAPDNFEVNLNLAQALARSGREEEAAALYRRLLVSHPESIAAWEDAATLAEVRQDWGEAVRIYREGIEVHPGWLDGRSRLGRALLLQGDPREAEAILLGVLAEDPRHPRAHLFLGEIQARQGQDSRALESWTTAHSIEPADPGTAVLLAGLYEKQGRLDKALEVLGRTRDLGGRGQGLLARLGGVMLKAGMVQEALAILQEAVGEDPEAVDAIGNLGMACALSGDLPGAVARFSRLVELDPDDAAAFDQLGSFYAGMGRLREAQEALERAADLDPANAGTQLRLGLALHRDGKLGRAAAAYRRAIELDPGQATAYYNLGMIERKLGHAARAQEFIDKALRLDPDLSRTQGEP
ncbi:MAG: tetratricopeptide repeat protein [Candidatus Krumholzibacteriia bacterium]